MQCHAMQQLAWLEADADAPLLAVHVVQLLEGRVLIQHVPLPKQAWRHADDWDVTNP
jgi:hypothetical protein